MRCRNKALEELIKQVKRRYPLIEVEVHEGRNSSIVILRARTRLSSGTIAKMMAKSLSSKPLPSAFRKVREKKIVVRKDDLERRKQKVLRSLLMGAQEVSF